MAFGIAHCLWNFFHSLPIFNDAMAQWMISGQNCCMARCTSALLATSHAASFSAQSPLALLEQEAISRKYDTMT